MILPLSSLFRFLLCLLCGLASLREKIPIETRSETEVTEWANEKTAPHSTPVYNPGFDVTPSKLIRSIFTDRGEISPVNSENIKKVLA